MGLIRKIFWVSLTLGFTFVFTILFEHGTQDFAKHAEKEWEGIKKLFEQDPKAAKKPAKK
ncbi:MAG: hypothetical protein JSR82_00315 [Verrucomicrobia bacterium]|nr:hypothetical protein [Verrucomicrobiota bacterium]